MKRMVTDTPVDNRDALLNFAYMGEDRRVKLRYADGYENVDLCEYIANNACCQEIDAEAVMDGACMDCDCRTAILYGVAIQAAELRERLRKYEDAEQEGRLVELPIKEGAPIYYIRTTKHGFRYVNSDSFRLCNLEWFNRYFGKTVFLTREEAETALKGGEG